MGYEVEVKFRGIDRAGLFACLAEIGAAPGLPVIHEDRYFAHPARDFWQTDEAFRIRSEGDGNAITYKGPKHGGPTKTREEIEVGFDPGSASRSQLGDILERLGFRLVAVVRKQRTSYPLESRERAMTVTLDEVADLGTFVEVETLAETPDDLPDAQAVVLELAGRLGLAEVEPRSYLRMLLEGQAASARNPPGQT